MKSTEKKRYYLGLDIGTDSVGYAATDSEYRLMKFKGEPTWGVTTFEAAQPAQTRRMFRTQRRRLDRRQQRVKLLEELFADEIAQIDPRFFIRRRESALLRKDKEEPFALFSDSTYTDREYAKKYPTIHHLIVDLMHSDEKHDVRLVFHACAWLVAHRGHFLFDVSAENADSILNFGNVYQEFIDFFREGMECELPWDEATDPGLILNILQMKAGVGKKEERFKAEVFHGKKPSKDAEENFPLSRAAVMSLLCGRKVKPADLFQNKSYEGTDSVSLDMEDEQFAAILAELGDDEGELLRRMRRMSDCSMLISVSGGKMISEAMVDKYDRHRQDLKTLKSFVKKYLPEQYNSIFRRAEKDNYVAYSGNVKSCRKPEMVKHANKEAFSAYLKKKLKDARVEPRDEALYQDIMARLDLFDFLPKQRDGENRVIPQQLYRAELDRILNQAAAYLPFLKEKDSDGLTAREKILSVFDFKVPYYVGPLGKLGDNRWCRRKAEGRIYPWNFTEKIDLDQSEEEFIRRMTNTCTYLPGEDVLPEASLLYSKFVVLNEINNLKINGSRIPVEAKQLIYHELFEKRSRVSVSGIRELLRSRGLMTKEDELTGIDEQVRSSLKSRLAFGNLLESGTLTEPEVEEIINHAAYAEDKLRLKRWMEKQYPRLTEADRKYIARLNLKGFGRLSRKLLEGIYETDAATGEARTIMDAMWQTNENLMQLLSERHSYREAIEQFAQEYYTEKPQTISDRLSEMYVSNAVKRPIIRTLDITSDVIKAMGGAPEKIFIEMARGASPDQRGRRTKTRKQQLLELYQRVKTEDARELSRQLEEMGEMADNRLQSDRLFLYYLQLGKCLYTGSPIDLSRLNDGTYNIEHIYPQSLVKDDSILNNEILVLSEINGFKSDSYPVPAFIRAQMRTTWEYLKNNGLMTEEKFSRLVRTTPFTEEEKMAFINRQLVETRQSTKAVAGLLKELYPETEIVYVKAGLVSEFRQEFDLIKCRAINDLHHAKDAYLNIAVGNVYHERFSRRWFTLDDKYNVQVKKIFKDPVVCGNKTVWRGEQDIALIKKTMQKNAIHLTRYAFCRTGGFFDQQPVKAGSDLVPLKKGLPTEYYGGYNKPTASFFLLAKYKSGKKTDISLIPVELLAASAVKNSAEFATAYAAKMLEEISGKPVTEVELLLQARPIKINTVFALDGMRMVLSGKSSGGKQLIFSSLMPLLLSKQDEEYIKRLDSFSEKKNHNQAVRLDSVHDKISTEQNVALYQKLTEKLDVWPFNKLPANQWQTLRDGDEVFKKLSTEEQVKTVLQIVGLFSASSTGNDLSEIKGSKNAGVKLLSYCLSNWKKNYKEVCVVDQSASGLYESTSKNLLELL